MKFLGLGHGLMFKPKVSSVLWCLGLLLVMFLVFKVIFLSIFGVCA